MTLPQRICHHAVLAVVATALFFPNLGVPSLWDIDEGNNAEAAREMQQAANWVVPTFNYELRVDKPALLYWLQIASYRAFGVNEFAARLPSALAALLTVLLAYELGRRMFDPSTGLLAGLILASTTGYCGAARFANPDALLNACTVMTLLLFWLGFSRSSRVWFVFAGASAALGVLAKGPVGLILPAAVVGLFLLWSGELRRLRDRYVLAGSLVFLLVALPWYVLVATDTKVQFLRGFILTHNIGRYLRPMEHHGGPLYYYLPVLLVGFAPWSAFLGLTLTYATGKRARRDGSTGHEETRLPAAYRFLWCWVGVYLLFFSLSGTKLPNYILPAYLPLALLTARFWERWRQGSTLVPGWAFNLGLGCLALTGLGAGLAVLAASGRLDLGVPRERQLPDLGMWALLGALPVLAAVAAWWFAQRQARGGVIICLAAGGALLLGALFGAGAPALDTYKAPRALAQAAQVQPPTEDVRVGCYQYFQPSLVFYCQREVHHLNTEEQTLEFLRCPLPAYLILPLRVWDDLQEKALRQRSCRLLARHWDLYRHCEVVVVTNR